ncbi:hypothetical protein HY522_10605 [bacterium]|nr:hypothetical protein [bacterium]
MEELISRVEGQIERVLRRAEELSRENVVLRRETERLRSELAEVSEHRDGLERRVRVSQRHVDSALKRLSLLTDEP